MRGPWPLPALFRYLARRSVIVPWFSVKSVRRPRIEITERGDGLKLCSGRERERQAPLVI
jgi:hypothetical protein